MTGPRVAIKKLHPDATIPAYQTPGSAGMDIHAYLPGGPVVLEPGQITVVPTGLAFAIPQGFEGQVRPRSGLATKHGISVPNAPGTIDSDYRGELRIALINLGREAFSVTHAMRIVQFVISPVAQARLEVVDGLDETSRGGGGFGSTGGH